MIRGFLVRLGEGALTLLVIVSLSFFMQRLAPGGPFDHERELPPETRRALEAEWGLDRPLGEQFLGYLGGIFRLPPDLKRSMTRPDFGVTELIAPRLAVSLSLGLVVLLFSLVLGIGLGALAAARRNGFLDHAVMALALLGLALPNFVIGPLLKWVFAIELGWLPESRWVSPASMVLPVLATSALYVAIIARMVRSGLVAALGQDFVRAARARGFSERRVLLVHALPAALAPVIAWLGPAAAGLAVGSVVIERVFDIPGLGNTLIDAAFNRDYTMVMGAVIVYSAILIALNLLADLLLLRVDPRIGERR
ncbi:MAG: ABC transporter permease [Planctomycetes bacterium]|nr:ABC transporter permease [Planctomycetota bacterium]